MNFCSLARVQDRGTAAEARLDTHLGGHWQLQVGRAREPPDASCHWHAHARGAARAPRGGECAPRGGLELGLQLKNSASYSGCGHAHQGRYQGHVRASRPGVAWLQLSRSLEMTSVSTRARGS